MQGAAPTTTTKQGTKKQALPKGWIAFRGLAIRPRSLIDTAELQAFISFAVLGVSSLAVGALAAYLSMLNRDGGIGADIAKIVGCLTIVPLVTFRITGGLIIPHYGSGNHFKNASKTLAAASENAVRIAKDPKSTEVDRVAVVTGSSGGLGLVHAAWLIASGYTVVFACRNQGRAETAMKEAIAMSNKYRDSIAKNAAIADLLPMKDPVYLKLELDSMEKVASFAVTLKKWMGEEDVTTKLPRRLEIFVNNAGMAEHSFGGYNADGVETVMFTNHVAPYLLTRLVISDILIPQYQKFGGTEVCRFVTLSSIAHLTTPLDFASVIRKGEVHSTVKQILEICFDPTTDTSRETCSPMFRRVKNMYAISKFANITLARLIPKWFEEGLASAGLGATATGTTTATPFVSSAVIHPGGVATDIFRHQKGFVKKCLNYALQFNLMKTSEQGALTQVWASTRIHVEQPAAGIIDTNGPQHNFRDQGNCHFYSDCHDVRNSILSLAAQDDKVHEIIEAETDKLIAKYVATA